MSRFVFVATLLALVLVSGAAQASTSGVVVSELYGGGGNSGASFRNDYVELFNTGASPVDLSSWTVQYATSTGTSWQATPLSGAIAAGGHYLVQLASNGATGSALPTPDATGSSNLAASSGKIALVRGATALTCGATAGSCSAAASVEDLVGYGDASDFEGSGSAPAPSNTLAAIRAGGGCTDTGENATDFTTDAPDPQSSGASAQSCGGGGSTSGTTGSAQVDVDVASVLSVSLDRASLSFGAVAAGTTPTPLAENVTVSSNNAAGYSLAAARTAFSPRDLPLALGASAPAGATLASPLAGGALAPISIPPAAALQIGSKSAATAGSGDVWPTRVGFASALPLVPSGRYAATVTYTATAR